jgi:hypothetical protein
MITGIISFLLVVWIFIFALKILPKLFLYGVVLIFMAIQFVAKKIFSAILFAEKGIFIFGSALIVLATQFCAKKNFDALLWIISAVYAVGYGLYALGRHILFSRFLPEENVKVLIAKKLPNQYNLRKRSLSLLIIELMIVKHDLYLDVEG